MNDKDTRQDAKIAKSAKLLLEPSPELDRIARAVIGAALTVHRTLGPGFLECTYEQALCIELLEQGIPFQRQAPITVTYKGQTIGEGRLDLLVDTRLIVELKSVEQLAPVHTAQVRAYLRATGYHLGLLLNFNVAMLRDGIERIVLTR